MSLFKRSRTERLPEAVQVKEIGERLSLSEQVYRRREVLRWSQDELATASGMTQPQIAHIEAGQANPTLRSIVRVAHALNCSVAELFRDDQEEEHNASLELCADMEVHVAGVSGWGQALSSMHFSQGAVFILGADDIERYQQFGRPFTGYVPGPAAKGKTAHPNNRVERYLSGADQF